jgi:2-iminoacetate synthase ThiH
LQRKARHIQVILVSRFRAKEQTEMMGMDLEKAADLVTAVALVLPQLTE